MTPASSVCYTSQKGITANFMTKEADTLNPKGAQQRIDKIYSSVKQFKGTDTPGQSGESPESPVQNLPPELTPESVEQSLVGVIFSPAEKRVTIALFEPIDQGLESNSLASIAFPKSTALPSNKRSNLRGLISKLNEKTRPRGVEVIGEEQAGKQYTYRWHSYHPEPPEENDPQPPDVENWPGDDESSDDSPPPVYVPRETAIDLSPENLIIANRIGSDIARIVTSQLLREKKASDKTPIEGLNEDILEVCSQQQRSEIDNSFVDLSQEEKRRVLLQSTITATERAWEMSERRQLDSKEDLAAILNCHGLASRGHFLGEITMRLTDHFHAETPPVKDPISTS